MLNKYYEVICDCCGSGIGHYMGNRKGVAAQAKRDGAFIKYMEGNTYTFCNEECYKRFLNGERFLDM